MAPEPMALAATAMAAGARCLVVTLGSRGAVYFASPDFHHLDLARGAPPIGTATGPVRTALLPGATVGTAAAVGAAGSEVAEAIEHLLQHQEMSC